MSLRRVNPTALSEALRSRKTNDDAYAISSADMRAFRTVRDKDSILNALQSKKALVLGAAVMPPSDNYASVFASLEGTAQMLWEAGLEGIASDLRQYMRMDDKKEGLARIETVLNGAHSGLSEAKDYWATATKMGPSGNAKGK